MFSRLQIGLFGQVTKGSLNGHATPKNASDVDDQQHYSTSPDTAPSPPEEETAGNCLGQPLLNIIPEVGLHAQTLYWSFWVLSVTVAVM